MACVYGAYDVEPIQNMRGRGAICFKTEKGIYQFKVPEVNEGRLAAEYEFKEKLCLMGFENIDRCMKNKEGELVTYDKYGNPYVMRKYFDGRECSVTNQKEIMAATENLAKFHIAGRKIFMETEEDVHIRNNSDFKKRNRELKRVYTYIVKKNGKNKFEEMLKESFAYFYKQAEDSYRRREADKEEYENRMGYCHGLYDHHSLLVTSPEEDIELATVNFDRFYVGNQLDDLYHFLRKVVEKNGYSYELAKKIIQKYSEIIKLNDEDIRYIYTLYGYPEKFYKLANQYMNSKKTRISPKMIEKLTRTIDEEVKKKEFLDRLGQYSI